MEADTDMEMDDEMLAEDQDATDKEDEHLGAKDGKESGKKQSRKDRRKEMRGEKDAVEEGVFGGKEKKWDRIAKGLDPSSDPEPEGEDAEAAAAASKNRQNEAPSRTRTPRHRATGATGMKIAGITAEGQDELVEAITKRVAARILKAALTKK